MSDQNPQPVLKQEAYNRLKALLVKNEQQIAKRLPAILTSDRMILDVLTAVKNTPKLLLCSPLSILGTVIQASEIGLRLNGSFGEAYMVPFWNRHLKQHEAQFQAGWRGFITLARRSGEVTKIEPRLAFTFDTHFEMYYGTNPRIDHKPDTDHPDYNRRDENGKGDLIGLRGAYAVCTYKDGTTDFEYCNINRLHELRNRSKARDSENNEVGPWITDPGEMYRKVPIRQLAKRLPMSSDDGRLQRAATLDNDADFDVPQNNAAIIEGDAEFSGSIADVVRGQVNDLRDKHVRTRTLITPMTNTAQRHAQRVA